MTKYIVQYELNGYIYQSEVITATSGAAIYWVSNLFPNAKDISVCGWV
jgi:hypothetical protein